MDSITRDVTNLDDTHRRALEDVLGRPLQAGERLVISVLEAPAAPTASRPSQSISDWTSVYDGLTDEEIEQIGDISRTRANLTRRAP